MLVITGTGRCGTSVLARFCHECGYDVGGKWFDDVCAGMEDADFAGISNAIEQDSVDDDVLTYIDNFPKAVVKDPRFLTGKVAGLWASRRQDLQVIICVRDMEHVAASVAAFEGHDKTHLEWVTERTHEMVAAYVSLARHRVPLRFLAFPDFLDDFKTVYQVLEWGGLPLKYASALAIWHELVDKNMVHHK